MGKLKAFGMVLLGVVVSLVVLAFIPASLKEKIPGVRSIN